MTDFERLELLLRRHGFLAGIFTAEDKRCVELMLQDIWSWFDQIRADEAA